MFLDIQTIRAPATHVELVERKGVGHPDTIADTLAEEVSVSLCRYYLERFGSVLHHNVDKVLISAGASRPALGGGVMLEPIDIYLGGRATADVGGVHVPVADLAVQSTEEWLRKAMPELDLARDVRVHCRIRQGSGDLTELFARTKRSTPLANDSSVGVGFAPLTELEAAVLETERLLNSEEFRARHPEAGLDVKLMGQRCHASIILTVARAFIGGRLTSMADYLEAKFAVAELVRTAAKERGLPIRCFVNAADQPEIGSIYLTVSGSSVESGDDGEVGRGNRVNGLITPHRPVSLEAAAGKNPVNHTGKLYNVMAREIARDLVERLHAVRGATCYLVSQIGRPINDPSLAQVILDCEDPAYTNTRAPEVRAIIHEHLDGHAELTQRLVDGTVQLF